MQSSFFINATGVVALAVNLRGLVQKSDRSLRRANAWSAALWTINSFLMDAHSAAAMSALSVGRQITASSVDLRAWVIKAISCCAFMLVAALMAAFTWEGLASASTAAASMLATYAMFYLHGSRLRATLAAVAALWVYNGIVYEAWWQLASTMISLGTAMFGAWRTRASW